MQEMYSKFYKSINRIMQFKDIDEIIASKNNKIEKFNALWNFVEF